jgi:hypothetical protein
MILESIQKRKQREDTGAMLQYAANPCPCPEEHESLGIIQILFSYNIELKA